MNTKQKSVLWAGIIIIAALICKDAGLGDSASFGITTGLVGAAWGTIAGRRASCPKGCV